MTFLIFRYQYINHLCSRLSITVNVNRRVFYRGSGIFLFINNSSTVGFVFPLLVVTACITGNLSHHGAVFLDNWLCFGVQWPFLFDILPKSRIMCATGGISMHIYFLICGHAILCAI